MLGRETEGTEIDRHGSLTASAIVLSFVRELLTPSNFCPDGPGQLLQMGMGALARARNPVHTVELG